ncbi:division/cell wall cluster transcriptional repressor MraZ [Kiloniella laminariae]|uniref:Transcriptional regulator MraZ n=1 Tax=Kiloniella laminariae TaxID=454162 RepID=A0ABT4LDX5_9PROT|nr:division/cell wall cluster transcriptional repressor MraZ [Kiloniella laminariae]MCZ4279302.1 division/cell wall cluster transcriptional repressor MraZ [Kiloniella laminariae]
MTFFLGTFENKVDKKGRVSVPATFRQMLTDQPFQGIVVFRSYRAQALEAAGMDFMRRLHESMSSSLDLFSDEHDDLATAILADAHQLSFDGEGRILLPPALIEHANITDRAAFVGKGDIFQIWNTETLEQKKLEARDRARDKKLSLSLNPANKGGQL